MTEPLESATGAFQSRIHASVVSSKAHRMFGLEKVKVLFGVRSVMKGNGDFLALTMAVATLGCRSRSVGGTIGVG